MIGFGGHSPLCLLYHRIASERPDPFGVVVSPQHFAEHLDVLQSWNVITAEEFESAMDGSTLPINSILLTFDDGYVDNFQCAARLLIDRQLPAVFFPVSDGLSTSHFWWDEVTTYMFQATTDEFEQIAFKLRDSSLKWRFRPTDDRLYAAFRLSIELMGTSPCRRNNLIEVMARCVSNGLKLLDTDRRMLPKEIRDLSKVAGFCIGAHSTTHERMSLLTDDAIQLEVRKCKDSLEQLIELPVRWFAYPYGLYPRDFDARSVDAVHMAGYSAAFSVSKCADSRSVSRYQMDRIPVPNVNGKNFREWLMKAAKCG